MNIKKIKLLRNDYITHIYKKDLKLAIAVDPVT